MKKQIWLFVLAIVTSALLTACGGGSSGGSTDNTNNNVVDNTTTQTSSIVNTITTPDYVAGSEELAAFNRINQERLHCGFGALKQNKQLDLAALNHANWIILNQTYGHVETQGTTGFTGINSWDRIVAAGYTKSYNLLGEVIAFNNHATKVGRGELGVRELFAGPYHSAGLLSPAFEVGISVRSPLELSATSLFAVTEITFATSTGWQSPASDEVLTYPCEGTSGVDYQLGSESPNPVPGRDLLANQLGHAVMIMLRRGNTLVITSASIVKASDNSNIALHTPFITGANDPNKLLGANEGYVVPDAPLEPSTSYKVNISGTNNGKAFTKSFSFTTGTWGGITLTS